MFGTDLGAKHEKKGECGVVASAKRAFLQTA